MLKEILLDEFAVCYDTNGWFVSVRKAIEDVTAEQAAWKPDGTDNTIWESLAHLTYYNDAYLQRFKGIDYEYTKADNDETFEMPEAPTDADWKTEVDKFDAVMAEWRQLLNASDDAKLTSLVPNKDGTKWVELISLINTHNAYHGGQILLLRKLQGAWNTEKGVS